MNIITRPKELRGIEGRVKVEKISRRSILEGLGVLGGLVLAAPVMSRQAFSWPSHPMEPLRSWRTVPKWERVSGPACP
jgi:hypothetical protein